MQPKRVTAVAFLICVNVLALIALVVLFTRGVRPHGSQQQERSDSAPLVVIAYRIAQSGDPLISAKVRLSKENKDGAFVTLLTQSVCTTCASGVVVRLLNKYKLSHTAWPPSIAVPASFTDVDIENLKTNLGISIAIERMGGALSKEFDAMIEEYGKGNAGAVLVIIKDGALQALTDIGQIKEALQRC